jgi:hypothetical protein
MVAVEWVDRQEYPRNVRRSRSGEKALSKGGGGVPDIQILRGTVFHDLVARQEVVDKLFFRLGDWPGLMGATMDRNTKCESARP